IELEADGQAEVIVRIVENVSLVERGAWYETCVELHCVQDADRLDSIGAFRIMRCAAYSAITKRKGVYLKCALNAPHDDSDGAESAIQHFHDKLLRIREQMKTETGRQIAEERHKLMVDFLAAVQDEYGEDV
ncbi:hypothetical protein BGW80DRAFT_1173625, partial [Lactifluus volemus]